MNRCFTVPALTLLALLLTVRSLPAQNGVETPKPDGTIRITPGAEYAAAGAHRMLFGALWRNLWTTEIEVETLDLKTFAGGLKPTKRGGGFQTKSLRFAGADGREYKFRSLNKDPRKVLPVELRETVVGDVIQDLISTSNPVSPLVASPILDAVGVLNARPRLVILPDDETLGEFRKDFGGLLGMLEENPTADAEEIAFGGSDKIVTTYKLFKRLEEDNDEQVDARVFLRARLVDIFMGDWDRHVDQWQWARYRIDDREFWRAIPRDRDQAFCRYDGLIPWLAENSVTQIEGCDDDYPKIEDLTWSGRYLDRKFLPSLERTVWDSITEDVAVRLTDSVIRLAVRRMPPEMFAKEGAELERTLLARRDGFREASREYYRNIAKYIDIRCSNKAEVAEIRRLDDRRLELTTYKRDKNTGAKKGAPLFHRVFDNDETKEIRLYLLDGDDSVTVDGTVNTSPVVRVIGGGGADAFVDNSRVDGYFLAATPIPDAETRTYFYDSGNQSFFSSGPGTDIDRSRDPEPKDDTAKWEPKTRDYGHDWRFGPWFTITPDEGLFIGGGPILYEFGFRAEPYVYRMDLRAGYATLANRFKVQYIGDFFKIIDGAHLSLRARASGLEELNFFGFGNETTIDQTNEDRDFYRIEQQQYLVHPTISFPILDSLRCSFGAELKYIRTELDDSSYINDNRTYGVENMGLARMHLQLSIDTRNDIAFPTDGVLLTAEGSYYPKALDLSESLTRFKAEGRAYLSTDLLPYSALALRAGAEKIWGKYPFFEAAFLGGSPTLRAYERERFAGDAAVYGNAELRLYLTKINVVVPGYFGIFLAGDAGKILMDGIASDALHGAYGGGIWIAPVEPANAISIAYMHSREKDGIYITGGFMF